VSVVRKLPRRPAKYEAALAALIHLYPDGLPDNKVTVVIWNSVNGRLRELGKQHVSQKTVKRALRDFPKLRGPI
jgi:hypothetical protein